jgi:hypothetical protein
LRIANDGSIVAIHMPTNPAAARSHVRPHIGVNAGRSIEPPGIGSPFIDDIGVCIAQVTIRPASKTSAATTTNRRRETHMLSRSMIAVSTFMMSSLCVRPVRVEYGVRLVAGMHGKGVTSVSGFAWIR